MSYVARMGTHHHVPGFSFTLQDGWSVEWREVHGCWLRRSDSEALFVLRQGFGPMLPKPRDALLAELKTYLVLQWGPGEDLDVEIIREPGLWGVSGSRCVDDQLDRNWLVTDGVKVAMPYLAGSPADVAAAQADAEVMVRSIVFD